MRTLFTARTAMQKAYFVTQKLQANGFDITVCRQRLDGGPCASVLCEGNAKLRIQIREAETLLGVALNEVQEQIERDMPFAQAAKRKKLNKAAQALPRGSRRLLQKGKR